MPESTKDRLKKMTAWDTEPALTDLEIDELMFPCCLKDKNGLAPSDPEWTPTYDLNAAAAAGWLLKAGRASSTVELGSAEATSKVFDNCRAMARIYGAKCRLAVIVNDKT
jgi:hypothetical protein